MLSGIVVDSKGCGSSMEGLEVLWIVREFRISAEKILLTYLSLVITRVYRGMETCGEMRSKVW